MEGAMGKPEFSSSEHFLPPKTVAERLVRDALYFVAVAKGGGAQVEQVKGTYQLDALVPTRTADIEPLKPVLRAMRDSLGAAKEAWNKFCAGAAVALIERDGRTWNEDAG